ncbi:MAG: hypothetical protein ABIL05_01815 [candidate division WOR-3 bacterium]
MRQFSLVTQGGYSDYRQAINAWEWPYTRKVRCIGLANHFTYDLGGEYYITVPSDFERIDLDDRSEVTENRFRIAPRLEADFSSFLSAAGIKFELSSEYFLFGPNVEYVRWYPQPDFYLNQITLRFGYVYIDDRARQNFLFPEARLDFFDGKISVDVGRGYRVYDWINEFKESRLTARENILPSPADSSVIEKDLIRIGSDLRIHPAQITIRTEFRRVDQPFYWTKDFGEILVYHTRVPKDVNILSAAVSWEKRSGWLQGRYIVASEDLPGLYRLEMSGGANYSFDPVADLDCDFKFFLLPYIAGDHKSILICDAGIERNILNLFTASFEVKNIFDQEYIIWPNLETGRQFLFQIKTQI